MLSWVSPVLGWALKCLAQGHFHEKNPEDPVRLEPRTPGLRVKHFIPLSHVGPCMPLDNYLMNKKYSKAQGLPIRVEQRIEDNGFRCSFNLTKNAVVRYLMNNALLQHP